MRIWLITVGEPLPVKGSRGRLLRTGLLAETLHARGHEVTWWTSTFDHWAKKHLFRRDASVTLAEGYRIILLRGLGYRRNVSLSRLFDHHLLARKFAKVSPDEPKPEMILCSLPTLELAVAATKYGQERGIPVVIDVRDMWPDIFLELVPNWAWRPAWLVLGPMFQSARTACAKASAITGHAPAFVGWGLRNAGRQRTAWDRDFPHGYKAEPPSPEDLDRAWSFWADFGLSENSPEFIVCFFGTMGRRFDLDTVIYAARLLEFGPRRFKFVLCGHGDNLAYYQKSAPASGNVIFPGWIGPAEIWTLMRLASAGLAPYYSTPSFVISTPNKAIEYLSAGLPIVSSLQGVLEDLLTVHDCGITYREKDPETLAEVLIRLFDQPERRRALGRNARGLFDRRFAAETVYADMSAYLEELARERK